MDRIAIQGGAQLNGEIPISGAKNSAIKLMAASILTDQPLRLTNMPRLADTKFLGQLLRQFGIAVTESDGPDGQQLLEAARVEVQTLVGRRGRDDVQRRVGAGDDALWSGWPPFRWSHLLLLRLGSHALLLLLLL